jgi:lipopolysaccharide/colanic/teichoic acid biosynthesis glycosyltransferase
VASIARSQYPSASPLPIHAVEKQGIGTRWTYFCCKRITDVTLATCLIVILFPLMLLIAALIKLDSRGPVLFTQKRIGVKRRIKRGRVIWMIHTFPFYKFRSMVVNADPSCHQAYVKRFREGRITEGRDRTRFKLVNDSRVTRLGRILRKTSLDELPQLVNVLKGEMSLVGPRPALDYEGSLYEDDHLERFCAVPGITGLWQATGRSQVPFDEMVQMDIDYVRRCSLWLDLKILALTIPAVVSCRGAA